MSDEKKKTERETRPHCDGSAGKPQKEGDRPGRFGCCGFDMRGMKNGTSCGSFLRKHPIAASAMFVAMGIIFIMVPAGAILGIVAFFRTF